MAPVQEEEAVEQAPQPSPEAEEQRQASQALRQLEGLPVVEVLAGGLGAPLFPQQRASPHRRQ